jgi:hypothetical protein
MRRENRLWGAPRIRGGLLILEIEVAQSTVAKYITGLGGPTSQGWKTLLSNHAADIASIDLFANDLTVAISNMTPPQRQFLSIMKTPIPRP